MHQLSKTRTKKKVSGLVAPRMSNQVESIGTVEKKPDQLWLSLQLPRRRSVLTYTGTGKTEFLSTIAEAE